MVGQLSAIPEQGGAYVLIAELLRMHRIPIGRLGDFDLAPGYYAYVGSACGAGGLRARIAHHLEGAAAPHWHIDYLLQVATPVEVWFAVADRKLEKDWVELLEESNRFRIPIPRFGASDYRRTTRSHLFYSRRRPAFGWFAQLLRERLAPEIRPHCLAVEPFQVVA